MNGHGQIIFGGNSRLQNLIFKGFFIDNECAEGDLYTDDTNSIKGTLRIYVGAENKIKFFTKEELNNGMDKFFVVYQHKHGDNFDVKKFYKHGEAIKFYHSRELTIGEEVHAKILTGDKDIIKKAGPAPKVKLCEGLARKENILYNPQAVRPPEFASKFENKHMFEDFVANPEEKIGTYKLSIELN